MGALFARLWTRRSVRFQLTKWHGPGANLDTGDGVSAQLSARDQPAQHDWDLTPLEERMVDSAKTGTLVDCGENPFKLAEIKVRAPERTVRAAVLRHLLVAGQWPVDAKGVRLRGVRVSGHLDLEAAVLRCPLSLENCYLDADEPACLDQATASRVTLTGCQLPGLTGDMLTAREIDLSGSTLTGPLQILGADITGKLICSDAKLNGRGDHGYALLADGVTVGGDVFLDRVTSATGAVRLPGAEIGGQLICRDAKLNGRDDHGDALIAFGVKVGADVFLDTELTGEGAVKLPGMEFTAEGAVRLQGAVIAGKLNCSGAKLNRANDECYALIADGVKIGADVSFELLVAAGTVSLTSAHVSGSIFVKPTALVGQGKVALTAARAEIDGALVWAPAAQVSGRVNLEGAKAGELTDVWRDKGAKANGYWPDDGRLSLDGFSYGRFGGDQQATVKQRLAWIRSQYQPAGRDSRPDFASQPYEQLAAVYRHAGQDTQARKVAIARRADLRKYGNLNPYRKVGNWLMDITIKYGYQTWRAGAGLAVLYVAAWALASLAQHHHGIMPAGNIMGLNPVPSATHCTASYPCFYPAGYAVDIVVPIINVHQAQYWDPNGHATWGRVWVTGTWMATVFGWALATLLVAGYTGLLRKD